MTTGLLALRSLSVKTPQSLTQKFYRLIKAIELEKKTVRIKEK